MRGEPSVPFTKRESLVAMRPLSSLSPSEVVTWLRCHRHPGPWPLIATHVEAEELDGDDFSLIESTEELLDACGADVGTPRELQHVVDAILIARVRGVKILSL